MTEGKTRRRRGNADVEALQDFLEDELITRVLRVVKSGKEATVYCCEAGPSVGTEFVAAKVYRSREGRGFQNDAVYQEGRVVLDGRIKRAMEKKTRKGREVSFGMWIGHEFEALTRLHAAGARVPRPIASGESALLLEFIGEAGLAAPPLHMLEPTPAEARELWEQIAGNVELFLSVNLIHGDLSPYNILVDAGGARIIDFPQAVDPRYNRSAFDLLLRDLENVYEFLSLWGARSYPRDVARGMWDRQVSIPVGQQAKR